VEFDVEPQRHDVEPVAGTLPGERVKGHRAGDAGEVDGEQVRADGAAVHPRHERIAVAADAARLVVEDLSAAERPSKHVRVVDEQRAQTVHDYVDGVHHQRHVRLRRRQTQVKVVVPQRSRVSNPPFLGLEPVKDKFRYAILVADRSEAGRRPASELDSA